MCMYCISVHNVFISYSFRERERERERFQVMLRCYYGKVYFANAEPTASTKSRSRISCWPVQYHPITPSMFSLYKDFQFDVSLRRSVSSDAVQLTS